MASYGINIVDLADEIAQIASRTTDPETARRLTELVERLLERAGLPPADSAGGGAAPPSGWLSDLVECVA